MNPLKMLLLVIVSTGLACSAFAIERTRNSGAPSPAVDSPAGANGGSLVSSAAAAVIEPGPQSQADRQPTSAVVHYAAVDPGRISARAAGGAGGVTAPAATRASAAPGGSGSPAMPESAEWMQLLCGLVVAGFIARRRASLVAD